jgi:hypothetical protein
VLVVTIGALSAVAAQRPVSTLSVAAGTPEIAGVWVPMGAGRGVDPTLAPPPATPMLLRPEYAKPYEAQRAAEAEAIQRGEPLATPAVACVPYGMPRMMAVASYPIEILPTQGQITIITEAFSEVRRVYLDQPQLPIDEVPPGYYGHSVGRWEGDRLVVDTVGIKESVPGYNFMPHSSQMRILERFRLVTPEVLHIQITIDDPVVLEKPMTYTLGYRRLRDYKMVEFVCENNREYIDEQGRVRMKLGGPSQ